MNIDGPGQFPKPGDIALPRCDLAGKRILDIGCSTGKDLLHPKYADAAERCGIDVDSESIGFGRQNYLALNLIVAPAEQMPFPDGYFDVVISRVALPYSELSAAFAEIARVLKSGGMLCLTMHTWRMQMTWLGAAIRGFHVKRVMDHGYIFAASLYYVLSGTVPARPWNGTRETFQTKRNLARRLRAVGFKEILCGYEGPEFIVQALRL